jgi:hypothetical protein
VKRGGGGSGAVLRLIVNPFECCMGGYHDASKLMDLVWNCIRFLVRLRISAAQP